MNSKAKWSGEAVISNSEWKLSRWPFQKTIAILLDKVQCKMFAHIIPVPRAAGADIDHYCSRRPRLAGDLATQAGKWSVL